MKRLVLTLVLLMLLCPWIHGQSKTTVTGTIQTPTGVTATSGYVEFRIRPASSSIAYRIGGSTVLAPQTSRCSINSSGSVVALLGGGPCQVWGNTLITPASTGYDVVFAPNGSISSTIQNELISGTTYDLSSPVFNASVNLVPQYQSITTAPIGANLVPAANKQINLGDSGHYYGQGFIDTLTMNTLVNPLGSVTAKIYNSRRMCDQYAGVDAGAKLAACYADLPSTGGLLDGSGLTGAQALTADPFAGATKQFDLVLCNITLSVSATITVPNNSAIHGCGGSNVQAGVVHSVIIKKTAGVVALSITGVGALIEGVEVDGNSQAGNGINVVAGRVTLRNTSSHNNGGSGIRIGDDTDVTNCNNWRLENVKVYSNTSHGLHVSSHATVAPDANVGLSLNLEAQSNGGNGIHIDRASSNVFVGGLSQNNTGQSINLVSQTFNSGNLFYGIYEEGSTAGGLFVGANAYGNRFIGFSIASARMNVAASSCTVLISDEWNSNPCAVNAVTIGTTNASNADINLNPGGTGQVSSTSFFKTQLNGAGVLGFRQYYLTNKRAAMDYSEATGQLLIANYLGGGWLDFAPNGGTVRWKMDSSNNLEGQASVALTTKSGSSGDITISPDSKKIVVGNGATTLQLGAVLQANLPASNGGAIIFCTDCTINTNPCAGGGGGALAVRTAGAWLCYGP